MSMLSKSDILNSASLKTKTVTVKEWGGDITITQMSAKETVEWLSKVEKAQKTGDGESAEANLAGLSLITTCVVDEKGDKMFSEEDFDTLLKQPYGVLSYVFGKCEDFNKAALKDSNEDIKEDAKN